jgi:DNA-binding CsgD family transcriptional regulator
VGQILNTTEHNVNYHLRRAMTKLAVGSKHQAAAKARAFGLL